jgi:hypothetical protein
LEPFGLFHFLQSLLSQPTNNEQTPPPTTEEEETIKPVLKEEKMEEKINACAAFLENHDARARRIRK